MLLSGFTFIRNARKYDFPIAECIESMLPIVDELVVNVGNSEDDTLKLISAIPSSKIKIVESTWDDSKTDRGLVLSEQTNIALSHCSGKWCLYLQADEAIHEQEHDKIRQAIERAPNDLDGFRFRYLHFYSGYSLIQRPWHWYPSEIRLIRRDSGAQSYGDAQTFRKAGDTKLKTELLNAHIFHYGHARNPEVMSRKIRYFHRFWHGDNHGIEVNQAYQLKLKDLVWYWGSHPRAYLFRVNSGKEWSPKPSHLAPKNFTTIVIISSKATASLASEVAKVIEQQANRPLKIEILFGMGAWVQFILSRLFRPRGKLKLIDLEAESRSFFAFIGMAFDALVFFRWRIAHAPSGTLSRFRARLYHAVNWGRHEKTTEGFQVPESEHPRQLARWSGFDL